MAVECDLTISFATTGNSRAFLGGGWARSEDSFTWCIGAESHLLLPRLELADEYVLTLDVSPFIHAPELTSQRLIVSVNDTVVGSTELSRPSLLGYRIPSGVARRADRMVVTLQTPDASQPVDFADSADDRHLAFALSAAKLYRVTNLPGAAATRLPNGLMLGSTNERSFGARGHVDLTEWAMTHTGLTIEQIALQFESLGENCEFGLFQRRCDAEPLGLLRFSSTFMRNLIRGIDDGFEGIGAHEDIDPRLEGQSRKEYMIHEKKFGLVYHTFVYEGQRSAWLMREQESARLKFLRRKFMEELESTDKIFVYKFGAGVTEEEILPLHMALNRYSEATLLWVVPAERDRPAGTVEVVMPGLLKGYIDRFASDENAHDLSFDGWLRVCANACVLGRLRRAAALDADEESIREEEADTLSEDAPGTEDDRETKDDRGEKNGPGATDGPGVKGGLTVKDGVTAKDGPEAKDGEAC
jgi:hypothetical protein